MFHTLYYVILEPFNKGKVSEENCEYEFRSLEEKNGFFMSPSHPGTYPNSLECTYKFIGDKNERILINFEEISINFGADQ